MAVVTQADKPHLFRLDDNAYTHLCVQCKTAACPHCYTLTMTQNVCLRCDATAWICARSFCAYYDVTLRNADGIVAVRRLTHPHMFDSHIDALSASIEYLETCMASVTTAELAKKMFEVCKDIYNPALYSMKKIMIPQHYFQSPEVRAHQCSGNIVVHVFPVLKRKE